MAHSLRCFWSLCATATLFTACGDDVPPEVTEVTTQSTPDTSGSTTAGSGVDLPDTTSGGMTQGAEGDTTTTSGPFDDTTTTDVDPDSSTTDGLDPDTGSSTDEGSTSSSSSEGETGSACGSIDLGSMVPHTEPGTTVGAGDDSMASCAIKGGNDEDVIFEWTAPDDGTYSFDTFGSSIDTILTLHEICDGPELDCNDDAPEGGIQSYLEREMLMGETVYIIVDGWNEAGDFLLNIDVIGGGATSTSTGGGMADPGFGDCATMDPGVVCLPDEVCLVDGAGPAATLGVCTSTNCNSVADCPSAPAGGDAPVVCENIDTDPSEDECALDCSGGQTCPTGMNCFVNFICVWPV
ncbi:MAG: hypothetical protein AAF799_30500 [Myxococcota bacterium]